MIQVLALDASAFMRKKIRDYFQDDPDIHLLAACRACADGLSLTREFQPDILILDTRLELTDRTGFHALCQSGRPTLFLTPARERGYGECLERPTDPLDLNTPTIEVAFMLRLKAAVLSLAERRLPGLRTHDLSPPGTAPRFDAVAIGVSTGGPKSILAVLPSLPADFPAPVFLVQHMPPAFTASYVQRLNQACRLEAREARDRETVRAGVIYLAPGARHLTLERAGDEVCIRLTPEPATLFVPSVNVMMHSVLAAYGPRTVGVLMTGMGSDGAEAMVRIRQSGGHTIAESRESAVVWGMPGEAVRRGGACAVLPRGRIAAELVRLLRPPSCLPEASDV